MQDGSNIDEPFIFGTGDVIPSSKYNGTGKWIWPHGAFFFLCVPLILAVFLTHKAPKENWIALRVFDTDSNERATNTPCENNEDILGDWIPECHGNIVEAPQLFEEKGKTMHSFDTNRGATPSAVDEW